MPQVPPNTITDVPKSLRSKLKALFYERSLLQYAFSFEKINRLMHELMDMDGSAYDLPEEELTKRLQDCIVAWNEDQAKETKAKLNNKITRIYTENGIAQTLRDTDPFGRQKDYIMMQGTATSFAQSRAMPILVAGVFEWVCPACKGTNYSTSDKNVYCMLKACESKDSKGKTTHGVLLMKPRIKAKHSMPVEAVQAAFDAATVYTPYTSLQARDIKEKKGD